MDVPDHGGGKPEPFTLITNIREKINRFIRALYQG